MKKSSVDICIVIPWEVDFNARAIFSSSSGSVAAGMHGLDMVVLDSRWIYQSCGFLFYSQMIADVK